MEKGDTRMGMNIGTYQRPIHSLALAYISKKYQADVGSGICSGRMRLSLELLSC